MALSVAAFPAGLQELPLPFLFVLATALVALTATAVRIVTNTFHGNAPPVDEGLPFFGGLIKFSKVSN